MLSVKQPYAHRRQARGSCLAYAPEAGRALGQERRQGESQPGRLVPKERTSLEALQRVPLSRRIPEPTCDTHLPSSRTTCTPVALRPRNRVRKLVLDLPPGGERLLLHSPTQSHKMQARAAIPGPILSEMGIVGAGRTQRAQALSAPHRQRTSPLSTPSSLSSSSSLSAFPHSFGRGAAQTAARGVPRPAAPRCHGAGGEFQVQHVRGGISGQGLKFGVVRGVLLNLHFLLFPALQRGKIEAFSFEILRGQLDSASQFNFPLGVLNLTDKRF